MAPSHFWHRVEELLASPNLGALPWRTLVRSARWRRPRREGDAESRVPIRARPPAWRPSRREPSFSSAARSILGREVRVGADGAGELADCNLAALRPAGRVRVPLREVAGQGDAEGGRLGVDAVRATDQRGLAVLFDAGLEGVEQRLAAGDQAVGRIAQQDGERTVEHIGRGHAEVQPARRGAGQLLDVGEEGDHVVTRDGLDLVDASRLELVTERTESALRSPAGTLPPVPSPRRQRARRRTGLERVRSDTKQRTLSAYSGGS